MALYNPISGYNPYFDPANNGGRAVDIVPIPIRAAEGAKNMPRTLAPVAPVASFDFATFARENALLIGGGILLIFLLKGK